MCLNDYAITYHYFCGTVHCWYIDPFLSSTHGGAFILDELLSSPPRKLTVFQAFPFTFDLISSRVNLLLVRSHKAEIIIVKRLIQGRNNVTRMLVEPRSCDQGHRKNDPFGQAAEKLINWSCWVVIVLAIFCNLNVTSFSEAITDFFLDCRVFIAYYDQLAVLFKA